MFCHVSICLLIALLAGVPARLTVMPERSDFEQSLQATLKFWTAPDIIDVDGAGHAWFDAARRRIPSTPDLKNGSDAHRPLIVQLRLLYGQAVAISRTTDPAERTRLQAQYQRALRYTDHYRMGVDDLYATAITDDKKILDVHKATAITQIYLVYILGECAFLTGDTRAAQLGTAIWRTTQRLFADPVNGGLFEEWDCLSRKIAMPHKSVGTQIHAALALGALYRAQPSAELKKQAMAQIRLVTSGVLQYPNGNGTLWVSADYRDKDPLLRAADHQVLYGHNAEMVWYTLEALKYLRESPDFCRRWAEKTARAVLENGLFPDGQMAIYGARDGVAARPDTTTWWIQLEGLNICAAMYELTRDEYFRRAFRKIAGYTFATMITPEKLWHNEYSSRTQKFSFFGGRGWKSGLHSIRSMRLILSVDTLFTNQENTYQKENEK